MIMQQMLESEVQQLIQVEASKQNITLFRNNSGAFKDSTGRMVRYGLGNISKKFNDELKSSDLIGLKEITITQDMVGQKFAMFIAIEVKNPDWQYNVKSDREQAQKKFIDLIISKGGRASFVKSVADFKQFVSTLF